MSLPVSSYEELLARVRSLTNETIQLRHEITSSLSDQSTNNDPSIEISTHDHSALGNLLDGNSSFSEKKIPSGNASYSSLIVNNERTMGPSSLLSKKKDEVDFEIKEIDEKKAEKNMNEWGPESLGLWHSGPSSLYSNQPPSNNNFFHQDMNTVASFTAYEDSEAPAHIFSPASRAYSHQQLGVKVEMVYNLLSMLDTNNREDMSKTFLAMSSSAESCHAMRQSGCLPLLVQLIYSSELDKEVRNRAAEALHNIVDSQSDEKRRRRELRVFKLLKQVREFCDELRDTSTSQETFKKDEVDKHPTAAVGALMKFSFDAEHRLAICTLGGLHAISELIQVDHEIHGNVSSDAPCLTLRRYAGMSLTNLTFGDGKNKALLCRFKKFMRALVDQLKSPCEDLRQVTASVLRNLSWRADPDSKQALRDVDTVSALTAAAMEVKKESTLKSILSALWNLSAHCSMNKVDICSVPGALAFLVKMLKYKSSSNTLAIVENAGGIIRNISSHIAVREDYRQILRENNCFEILLEHLKSPSLTIVSNACGTLWNLSARCSEDQKRLWDMGATTMLRSLIQSKHKMISMGSSAALKNLLTANPSGNLISQLDSTAKSLGLQSLPTLFVRKQKALEQELNITLAETCDNIEPSESPTFNKKMLEGEKTFNTPQRSDSHESIRSSKSDSVYERLNKISEGNENKNLVNRNSTLHESYTEKQSSRKAEDQKLITRYKTSMIPTPTSKAQEKSKSKSSEKENASALDNETELEKDKEVKAEEKIPRKGIPVLKSRPNVKSVLAPKKITANSETSFLEEKNPPKNDDPGYRKHCSNPPNNGNPDKPKHSLDYSDLEDSENVNDVPRFLQPSQYSIGSIECGDEGKFFEKENNCVATQSEFIQKECEEIPPSLTAAEKVKLFCKEESIQQNQIEGNKNIADVEVKEEKLEHLADYIRNSNNRCVEEDVDVEKPSGVSFCKNQISTLNTSNSEETPRKDDAPKFNETLVPAFRIGSEISGPKNFQMEANKVCREIQKYQEADMGCSLTSDVSLISCGSFLDPNDFSLFETSHCGSELGNSGDLDSGKFFQKTFNFPKNFVPNLKEPISMPSLGSLKNENLEAFDLESSIISVASITSEIADTYSKDKDNYGTYTKTYKNNENADCNEETIADLATLSNEEETLNADLLHENANYYDEDNSLHLQENLPLDPEISSPCKPEQPTKKLTPKEKRKTYQDRYRTYTIRDLNRKICPGADQEVEAVGETKLTPKQKRNTEKDRFLTRTLEKDESYLVSPEIKKLPPSTWDPSTCMSNRFSGLNLNENHYERNGNIQAATDFSAPYLCFDNKHSTIKTSKSFDKNFGYIQNLATDSKSLNDLLSIGPDERRELLFNAKLVAFSLKTAVHEVDQDTMSDSDADEPQKTLTIDTNTYNKYNKVREEQQQLYYDNAGDEEEEEEEEEEKKGPKILKPNEKVQEEKTQDIPKGIRGRRKQLYFSPAKKFSEGVSSTPNSPKILIQARTGQYNLTTTKSLPNVSKTVHSGSDILPLQRQGTFTKESTSKETFSKTSRGIPVLTKRTDTKVSASNESLSRYKVGSKTLKSPGPIATKNTERKPDLRFVPKRQSSLESAKRVKGTSDVSNKRLSSPALGSRELKNSSSNQSLKTTASSPKNTPNTRAKSFGSANLPTSKSEKGKQSTPKKEVTSKIASLWKKVEESKQKTKNVKDDRVWIEPEKHETDLCVEQEEILEIPAQKIVHSYTCHDLPENVSRVDFTRHQDEERTQSYGYSNGSMLQRNQFQKRKVVSAIVSPFNYNPPESVNLRTSPIKPDSGTYKSSQKITTV